MPTLQQSLETLDGMITNHASIPETRSQLAYIQREVAALEAAYRGLVDANAKLREENQTLKAAAEKKIQRGWDELKKREQDEQEMLRSKQLKH